MEGGESEPESDSGVAPSLASSQSADNDTRVEPQPTAVGDDKRRSARRKEYALLSIIKLSIDENTFCFKTFFGANYHTISYFANRFIMAELLQTERAYVKDLETCITCYLREMRTDPGAVPQALQGKVHTISNQTHVFLD